MNACQSVSYGTTDKQGLSFNHPCSADPVNKEPTLASVLWSLLTLITFSCSPALLLSCSQSLPSSANPVFIQSFSALSSHSSLFQPLSLSTPLSFNPSLFLPPPPPRSLSTPISSHPSLSFHSSLLSPSSLFIYLVQYISCHACHRGWEVVNSRSGMYHIISKSRTAVLTGPSAVTASHVQ